MKPTIGITVDSKQSPDDARSGGKLSLNWNYAQAVADAGGVPVLIPPTADMEAIAEIIDGWLIPGGNDIDAVNFGEENHHAVDLIDPARFAGEQSLFGAVSRELPIFGICYGCQRVNVFRGGSLIQHLPDVEGRETHTGGVMQEYKISSDSKIGGIVGDESIEGKSYHHQGIKDLGRGLQASALHGDGTIEAIEDPNHPWLVGLQWHPERTFGDPKTRRIFEDFVRAAAAYRDQRHLARKA